MTTKEIVMVGLVPTIHVFAPGRSGKAWMLATGASMTAHGWRTA